MAKASGTDLAGFKAPARDHLPCTARRPAPWPRRPAARSRQEDGPGAQVLLRPRLARRGRQDRRRGGHRVPGRRDARQQGEHQDALRREPTCRWRRTASSERAAASRASADQSAPGARRGARPRGAAVRRCCCSCTSCASHLRLAENPTTSCCRRSARSPTRSTAYAFEEDRAAASVLFWADTWASLQRIGSALAISATLGMLLAVGIGVVPRVRALLSPLLRHRGDDSAAGDPADPVHRARPRARPRRSR